MATQQIAWTILAGALILFWLSFSVLAAPKIDTAGTIVVMQYGRAFGVLSLLFALTLPTALAIFVWYVPWQSEQKLALAGCCFLMFSLSAGLLLIEVVCLRVVVTADGIARHSPWTGAASVKWSDVTSVRWSPINRWLLIRSDSAVIRVSQFLTGQRELSQAIAANVAAERRIGCALTDI